MATKWPVSQANFVFLNRSKKLQSIFEMGFNKIEVILQKSVSEKKYFNNW